PFARKKIALACRKDDCLFPARSRLLSRGGDPVGEVLLNGDEISPLNHARRKLLGSRTDLRALDAAFGSLAVIRIIESVGEIAGQPIALSLIAPRLHDPVDNIQAEAQIAEPGFLVEKRLSCDPRNIALL